MRRFFHITAALLLFAVGCSEKPKSKVQTVFVHGDPMNWVAGAKMSSRMDGAFFENVDRVYISHMFNFVEKRTSTEKNFGIQVEKEMFYLKVTRQADRIILKDLQGNLVTQFFKEGKYWVPEDKEILHISASKNGKFLSVLTYDDSESGRSLQSYVFAKNIEMAAIPKTSEIFSYIMGKGKKVVWEKNEIQVDICGVKNQKTVRSAERAIAEWKATLQGKLTVKSSFKDKFAPFSDLNQHCFYVVDSYIYSSSKKRRTLGVTFPVVDVTSPAIIDSDVFIISEEFAKGTGYDFDYDRSLDFTTIHEFGHFFGLDHVPNYMESVMTYNFDLLPNLYSYDKRAAKALYE